MTHEMKEKFIIFGVVVCAGLMELYSLTIIQKLDVEKQYKFYIGILAAAIGINYGMIVAIGYDLYKFWKKENKAIEEKPINEIGLIDSNFTGNTINS